MAVSYTPVYNWRNKKNKSSAHPIHIRITIDRKQRYYFVKVPRKVKATEWTGKPFAWVKNTHPFALEINSSIKEHLDSLDALLKRLTSLKKPMTFPLALQELKKHYNTDSFNAYFEAYNASPRDVVETATVGRYKACEKLLRRFNAHISFADLSSELMTDFKKFCQDNKYESSTIRGYFNAIKRVIYWARKEQLISKDHAESIFEDVSIEVQRKTPEYLEVEEIIQWRDFDFGEKKKVWARDRDMFLLLIYTGFYYSDLKELQKTDLREDPVYGKYIYTGRFKNSNLAIIPLWKFPHALELLKKYSNKDQRSPYVIDRQFVQEDQPFNRSLKRIAAELGWTREIKNKLGRKTNAQLWIRHGADRPIVSRMLGHEKEETTKEYYDVNIREVIAGTAAVNFREIGL